MTIYQGDCSGRATLVGRTWGTRCLEWDEKRTRGSHLQDALFLADAFSPVGSRRRLVCNSHACARWQPPAMRSRGDGPWLGINATGITVKLPEAQAGFGYRE